MVPLQFWFCRNPGLALPLIALQYHEVKLKFAWGTSTPSVKCSVFCDYIYLDTDERRRFAQVSHEYLIEQLQYQKGSSTNSKTENLKFNHPVKELLWVSSTDSTFDNHAKLVFNGHDRFSSQPSEYFKLKQPFDYHTAIPRQNLPDAARTTIALNGTGDIKSGVIFDGSATVDEIGNMDTRHSINSTAGNNWDSVAVAGDLANKEALIGKTLKISILATDGNLNNAILGRHFFGVVDNILVNTNLIFKTLPVDHEGIHISFSSGEITTTGDLVMYTLVEDSAHVEARTSKMTETISIYSFSLKPEEHQPSGTCNFSRLDDSRLIFSGGTGPIITNIYAVNYNVLRIMSGMGGLAYSN
jgi:hypothetical protein